MTKLQMEKRVKAICVIIIFTCAMLTLIYAASAKAGLYGWGASLENGRQNKTIAIMRDQIADLERRVDALESKNY